MIAHDVRSFTLGRYAPVRVLGLQALEASSAAESTEDDHATLTRARARTRAPTPTPAPALTLTLTLTLTPSLTPTLTLTLTLTRAQRPAGPRS